MCMSLLFASNEHVIRQHILSAVIPEDEVRLYCWLIASHSRVGLRVEFFFFLCVIIGAVG